MLIPGIGILFLLIGTKHTFETNKEIIQIISFLYPTYPFLFIYKVSISIRIFYNDGEIFLGGNRNKLGQAR
jgi:hypothetical protein